MPDDKVMGQLALMIHDYHRLVWLSRDLLDSATLAIKRGDWDVDGANDPELIIQRLKEALDNS